MVFSNFKWDHKADDCILIEYQKMSLIEEITVEDLDHLGIVARLIDEIGIVELINQKLGVDNWEKKDING